MSLDRLVYFGQVVRGGKLGVVDAPPPPPPPPPRQGPPPPPPMEEGDLRDIIARLEEFLNGPLRLNQAPLTQEQVAVILRDLLHPEAGMFRPDLPLIGRWTVQLFRTTDIVIGALNWAPGADAQNIQVGRDVVTAILNAANARLGLQGGRLRGGMDNQENLNGEDYAEEVLPPVFPDNNITDAVDAIHSEILAALGAGPLNADDIEERFEAFLMRQTPGVQAVIGYFRNTHEYQPDYTQDRNMTNGRNYWNWLDGLQDRMEDGD